MYKHTVALFLALNWVQRLCCVQKLHFSALEVRPGARTCESGIPKALVLPITHQNKSLHCNYELECIKQLSCCASETCRSTQSTSSRHSAHAACSLKGAFKQYFIHIKVILTALDHLS
jgi:hypothetical protein